MLLIAFSGQRFLTDILAGCFMFFEGWFAVGDNITIEPWSLEGIVEEVGLRSTRLRTVTGEVIRVNNSAIYATRVVPPERVRWHWRCTSPTRTGAGLIDDVASIVPKGATQFVIAPWVEETEKLADGLVRMRVRASVAYGREWLADRFMPDLMKERAPRRSDHARPGGRCTWTKAPPAGSSARSRSASTANPGLPLPGDEIHHPSLVACAGMQRYTVTTLDGGERIVSERVASVRSISIGIWIGAGSRDETAGQAGISHFIEHMLFKGSAAVLGGRDRRDLRRPRGGAERRHRRRSSRCCTPASSTRTWRRRST